jgi:ankyrin repeat protein
VAALLAAGAQTEAKTSQGFTALMAAAYGGHDEAVAALLAGGAQTEAKNSQGDTALMLAAGNGHADAVAALLAGGARKDATARGQTALNLAQRNGHVRCVAMLSEVPDATHDLPAAGDEASSACGICLGRPRDVGLLHRSDRT